VLIWVTATRPRAVACRLRETTSTAVSSGSLVTAYSILVIVFSTRSNSLADLDLRVALVDLARIGAVAGVFHGLLRSSRKPTYTATLIFVFAASLPPSFVLLVVASLTEALEPPGEALIRLSVILITAVWFWGIAFVGVRALYLSPWPRAVGAVLLAAVLVHSIAGALSYYADVPLGGEAIIAPASYQVGKLSACLDRPDVEDQTGSPLSYIRHVEVKEVGKYLYYGRSETSLPARLGIAVWDEAGDCLEALSDEITRKGARVALQAARTLARAAKEYNAAVSELAEDATQDELGDILQAQLAIMDLHMVYLRQVEVVDDYQYLFRLWDPAEGAFEDDPTLAYISIQYDNGGRTREQARKLAGEIARRARREDFAELARVYSDDPATSIHGGNLGQISTRDLRPNIEEAVEPLVPGEVADAVEVGGAFLVFKRIR
jgi:hypothetical protein